MSPLLRLLASAVLLLSAAAPSVGAATAAPPVGAGGHCPGETGVTVVVDFTDLGGDVVVRCAPGDTGTGLDALTAAGFTFEGTQRWGTAFVCRLQGRPTPDEQLPITGDPDYTEQCVDTPPTTASWSYSYAKNGGEWVYSTSSAKTHRAIEGGFEGWRFTLNGSATEPSVAPLRPGSDTGEPPEPQEPDQPEPDEPEPDKPEPSPEPPSDRPSDRPTEAPTDEPTEQQTEQPTDEPTEQSSGPASVKPGRPDEPRDKKLRKDKPDRQQGDKGEAEGQPGEGGPGSTAQGANVTGELPAESAADAEQDATSGTTTLLGIGLLGLLGAGAAITAYRRRSQQP